jgi:Flp pilus assembly protein TadB
VAEDCPSRHGRLTVAAAAIKAGRTRPRRWPGCAAAPDASVLASAVAVQLRVGGDLATLLDGLAEALVERDAQRRAAEVATAAGAGDGAHGGRDAAWRRCWAWR